MEKIKDLPKNKDMEAILWDEVQIGSAEEWIKWLKEHPRKEDFPFIEELWLRGFIHFSDKPLYLKELSRFYLHWYRYEKALKYIQKYLEGFQDKEAVEVALLCFYALERRKELIALYEKYLEKEKEKVDPSLLSKVGISYLYEGEYKKAEEIFLYIKEREKIPSLPSFDEWMKENFPTDKERKEFIRKIEKEKKEDPKKISLHEGIVYAMCLMYEKKYKKAEEFLRKYQEYYEAKTA